MVAVGVVWKGIFTIAWGDSTFKLRRRRRRGWRGCEAGYLSLSLKVQDGVKGGQRRHSLTKFENLVLHPHIRSGLSKAFRLSELASTIAFPYALVPIVCLILLLPRSTIARVVRYHIRP